MDWTPADEPLTAALNNARWTPADVADCAQAGGKAQCYCRKAQKKQEILILC